jgi:hypothetical protein
MSARRLVRSNVHGFYEKVRPVTAVSSTVNRMVAGSSPARGAKTPSLSVHLRPRAPGIAGVALLLCPCQSTVLRLCASKMLVYSLVSGLYQRRTYQHGTHRTRIPQGGGRCRDQGQGRRQGQKSFGRGRASAVADTGRGEALAARLSLRGQAEGSRDRCLSGSQPQGGAGSAPRRQAHAEAG